MKILKKVIVLSIAMVILFSGCVDNKDDNIKPTPTSTPGPIINEKAQKVVDLATQDLAKTISVSVDDIKVTGIEENTWTDSSLGYPEPNGQYLTVMTPGYKIFLTYNDKTYEYHSDYERVVPPPEGNKEKQQP